MPTATKSKTSVDVLDNPFATGTPVVITPDTRNTNPVNVGVKPANVDVPAAPIEIDSERMTPAYVCGIYVIQPILHAALSNLLESSQFDKPAPGDYPRLWNYCRTLGNLMEAEAKRAFGTPDARLIARIANALKFLYSDGLSRPACLNMFTVLNGGILAAQFEREFMAQCLAMKRTLAETVDGGMDFMETRRQLFDDTEYQAFVNQRAALNAREYNISK
jgi:hypothetical protein